MAAPSSPRVLSDEAVLWRLTLVNLAAAAAVLLGTFLPSLIH